MRWTWSSVLLAVACGGSPPPPPPKPAPPPPAPAPVEHVDQEQQKRDEIVAAHRKIEEEQQTALAASCDDPKGKHERCITSCYTAEAPDPRAGKHVVGAVEIQHIACQRGDAYAMLDELDPKLQVRRARGMARPHKKGTWQADVETALGKGYIVASTWHDVTHPITKEKLRCVAVWQRAATKKPLDACAGTGEIACEAAGNAAAHGENVVHFRLAEAHRLQADGKTTECQQAALEAIAVSRGMPRWRQYAKLNVHEWGKAALFRTRFDGVLDEDALFATAASLGAEAEQVYAACGGGEPKTSAEQEQSFHTCW